MASCNALDLVPEWDLLVVQLQRLALDPVLETLEFPLHHGVARVFHGELSVLECNCEHFASDVLQLHDEQFLPLRVGLVWL